MDITHDNVCSSMLSCFYSHLLSTGRPISSFFMKLHCGFFLFHCQKAIYFEMAPEEMMVVGIVVNRMFADFRYFD